MLEDILAVPVTTAAVGVSVEVAVEGVFTIDKTTGETWTFGEKLYWDDATKKLTTTAASNKVVGFAAQDAASGDTEGNAKLQPGITA